jgi:hypothetical protein
MNSDRNMNEAGMGQETRIRQTTRSSNYRTISTIMQSTAKGT